MFYIFYMDFNEIGMRSYQYKKGKIMKKVYLVYFYWYNWEGYLEPTLDGAYTTEELAQQAVEKLRGEEDTRGGQFDPFYEEMEVKDKLE